MRNRLFSVEEQIWLHDFAVARPGLSKSPPLPDGKYNALLRARGELLDEYPVTKLYTDLMEAQQRNMSYAAMYLERLIGTFNRQLPISMLHVNQIAVISDRGRIVNLMRGQGNVYHRLVPSSVTTEKDVTRQFQHPAFSSNGKYVAFSEMHFKDKGIASNTQLPTSDRKMNYEHLDTIIDHPFCERTFKHACLSSNIILM